MNNPISHCKAQCKLTNDDICSGCNRTLDEIVNWASYTFDQKNAVIQRLNTLEDND
ncbi:DUF1289 domain-containing protein [Alteromonas sp. BMJM2]|uniref:DUF1289 domain-containing protein n=1 Tax=Alteromonas sp. BMJM2 TaxID=2954241 RepID=UPI0022B44FC4|nr:DUF1289 domain-containing protein [Alteromonas sp. BMJM2]